MFSYISNISELHLFISARTFQPIYSIIKKNVPPEIVFSQIKYFLVDLHEWDAKIIIDNLSNITLNSHHGGKYGCDW